MDEYEQWQKLCYSCSPDEGKTVISPVLLHHAAIKLLPPATPPCICCCNCTWDCFLLQLVKLKHLNGTGFCLYQCQLMRSRHDSISHYSSWLEWMTNLAQKRVTMSSKMCPLEGPDADRVRCQPTDSPLYPMQLQNSSPMWGVYTDPSILVPILFFSQGKRCDEHSCITLISPPATQTAFPSPLMLEPHHIPQHWRFFEPCPAALRWYTSQGMPQMPGGRIDPQCHDLTLHSATQQYGCIQDPVWERTCRATSHVGSAGTWHTPAQEGTTRPQTWPSREGSRLPGEIPLLLSSIILVNFGITKTAKNSKATGNWQHHNTMGRRSSCAASIDHLSLCSVQPGCWAKVWYCLSFVELCAPQRYWAEKNPGWPHKQTFSWTWIITITSWSYICGTTLGVKRSQ